MTKGYVILHACMVIVSIIILLMMAFPYPGSVAKAKSEIGIPAEVDKFVDPVSGITCYVTINYKNISCVKTKD